MSPMPMSGLGGYVDHSQPRNSVECIINDIFQRHGLIPTTDVEQPSPYGGGGLMGMQLDAEAINKLKADKAAWDDTPAAEKIVNVMIELACRQKKDRPDPTISRMVGIVPATNRAVIIVVYSFTPIAIADISDLRKVGRWTMAVRDERGNPTVFAGDIHDHEELKGALEVVTAICAKHKKDLGLDSLMPDIGPMGRGRGMLIGARGDEQEGYVSVPADYRNIGAEMERIPPGEGVGYRRRRPQTIDEAGIAHPNAPQITAADLTPEQIAALRQTAIRTGAFEEFLEALPDQPPMTTDELEASMRQQVAAAIDESDVPPEHRH